MTNLTRIATPFPGAAQIWDDFFNQEQPLYQRRAGLSYQIKSEDEAVIAEVEVPGVNPKDVKIRVEGRAVHVETPRGNAYFTIGSRVDIDHVTATIRHGLLSLRVPKREAKMVEVVVEVEDDES
jgi:HSP20 family molecular chaperone IbpA